MAHIVNKIRFKIGIYNLVEVSFYINNDVVHSIGVILTTLWIVWCTLMGKITEINK